MFQHAYDGYLKYASKYDELRPISCDGVDTWGSYSLTLIDALDTLVTMGNYTEFRRVVDILIEKSDFDSDINVSVFETNIRIVGGLLSAHLLSHRAGVAVEPGWPCNGPLLRLAEDVAKRLLPAFDTKTGMPYGTVNLRYGVPAGETSVTCTAGVGTFIIEFGALSRLTGDPIYEEVALNALYALHKHQSPIGLYGNHIDVQTGRWTAQDAGIGAGVDSYYEYLVKGSLMLNRPELMHMFVEGRKSIDKYLKRDDWHIWVSMNKGQVTLPVFQSLEAYWPGVLSLLGDVNSAMKTLHNYHTVWKQYGFLPEFFNIPNAEAGTNRENYPLRPELIESVMYLYRATGDPYLLEVGEDILRSIQHSAKTPCGYATIKNVRDHQKEDRMESFFLAETTKYLYLLFDPDNFLNNDGRTGTIIETVNGDCLIDAGGYIFNTEAHPIDPSALRCCYDMNRESLLKDYSFAKYSGDVFQYKFNSEINDTTDGGQDEPGRGEENRESLAVDVKIQQPLLETQKNLINEIMKILVENKMEEKRAEEEFNEDVKVMTENDDDSLIKVGGKSDVEIVKLPASSRDPDEIKTEPIQGGTKPQPSNLSVETTIHHEDELPSSTNKQQADDTSTEAAIDDDDDDNNQTKFFNKKSKDLLLKNGGGKESNNSILTEFVQSILKSASKPKAKFDAQEFLQKIKTYGYARNQTWNTRYELLTCNAQPYLQRISVLGEFY